MFDNNVFIEGTCHNVEEVEKSSVMRWIHISPITEVSRCP